VKKKVVKKPVTGKKKVARQQRERRSITINL